jgi:hypothetical protein
MARVLTLCLLVVLLVAGYVALHATAEAGKGLPAFSVYSGEQDGLAAAARVLRKLGFTPVALSRPIQHTHYQGLLILVEPRQKGILGEDTYGLSEKDSQALLKWVAQGNTLVLMGRHSTSLHEQLGISLALVRKSVGKDFELAEASEVGGYTEPGAAEDTMAVRHLGIEHLETVALRTGLPLWMVGNRPGALLVPHGEGRVLVVADPSLWTHRGLLRGDNVLFLYNVAALDAVGGQVYFDEYHHGLRSGGGYWDYFRLHDQHWDVLLVLAVVALACWSSAVRLGPAIPMPEPRRPDAVDYASAVARIYQRAGVIRLLAQNMVRDFLGVLTAHLRLRRSALPAQILASWKGRYGAKSVDRLAALFHGVSELRRVSAGKEMSERELLAWSRNFDDFLRSHRLSVGSC